MSLLDQITPGTRVTIAVPGGIGRGGVEYTRRTGRAVMRGPYGWVLNLGGPHGTPGVATEENIIKVHGRGRRSNPELMVVYNPMPEVPRRLRRKLSVPEQHQLRIARQTLRYSDAGARIMGGMTKDEARQILGRHGLKSNPYAGHGAFRRKISKRSWNQFFKENLRRLRPDVKPDMHDDGPHSVAYFRDELELSPGAAAQAIAQIAQNPHGSSMHWGRHLGQMSEYKPVSKRTHSAYIAWLTKDSVPGEEVPTFDKVSRGKHSIRADRLEEFRKQRGHLERRGSEGNPRRSRGRMTVTYKERKTMARKRKRRRRRNTWFGDRAGHRRAALKGWRRKGRKRRGRKGRKRTSSKRRRGHRRRKGGGGRVRYRKKLYSRAALAKKIGKRKAAAMFARRKGKKSRKRRRKFRRH